MTNPTEPGVLALVDELELRLLVHEPCRDESRCYAVSSPSLYMRDCEIAIEMEEARTLIAAVREGQRTRDHLNAAYKVIENHLTQFDKSDSEAELRNLELADLREKLRAAESSYDHARLCEKAFLAGQAQRMDDDNARPVPLPYNRDEATEQAWRNGWNLQNCYEEKHAEKLRAAEGQRLALSYELRTHHEKNLEEECACDNCAPLYLKEETTLGRAPKEPAP